MTKFQMGVGDYVLLAAMAIDLIFIFSINHILCYWMKKELGEFEQRDIEMERF